MKPIPKAIRIRINQLAHRQATQHALLLRDSLMAEAQAMVDDGMAIPELSAALERIGVFAGTEPGKRLDHFHFWPETVQANG